MDIVPLRQFLVIHLHLFFPAKMCQIYTTLSVLFPSRGGVCIQPATGHSAADRRDRLQTGRMAGATGAKQPVLRFFEGKNSVRKKNAGSDQRTR